MKNIKTKSYLLWLLTIITLWVTYAYSSVLDSLNYLRWAWDTWHIGYIITEMFDTNAKIKSQYLPSWFTVENATTSVTWIVMLDNATGSTLTTKAPTINILTQVWNDLNTRINSLVSTALTIETDPVWIAASWSYYTKTQVDSSLNLKENLSNKSSLTTLWTSNTLYPTQNAVKSYVDTWLALKAPIASPSLTGIPTSVTPTDWDISTKIATTAFVEARMAQAAWSTTIWKYQISCTAWYNNYITCCRTDTETWETKCTRANWVNNSWNYNQPNPFNAETTTTNSLPWFFVLTNGTRNWNLWWLAWANAKCLSDLTTYDWMWKASAGTLSSDNVKAWLCDPFSCQNPNGNKIYTFAKSWNASIGWAKMIVNSSQQWPNDSSYWNTSAYFWSTYYYWTNRSGTSALWYTYVNQNTLNQTCQWWESSSSSYYWRTWYSASNNNYRFLYGDANFTCNNNRYLICIVN